MHQIDNDTAISIMPAIGAIGPNPDGYFSAGDPLTETIPTRVDADWLNAIMLEILNVLDGASIAPDKTKRDQLYSAIYKLTYGSVPDLEPELLESPLTADLTLVGIVAETALILGGGGAGSINFNAAQTRLHVNEYSNFGFSGVTDDPIEAFSDDSFTAASASDVISPSQRAAKEYLDSLNYANLAVANAAIWRVITGHAPGTYAAGTSVKFGYAINVPIITHIPCHYVFGISWATPSTITAWMSLYVNGVLMGTIGTGSNNTTGKSSGADSTSLDFDPLDINDVILLQVAVDAASTDSMSDISWSIILQPLTNGA